MIAGVNIYAVTCIASIVMLILLLVVSHNQNITNYLLMYVMIIIANIGYYALSTSQSLEAALIGNRLIYLGGVFIPIFLLFSTMNLCHAEVPVWLVALLLSLSTIVLYFAFSVGIRNDYYTSVTLGSKNGLTCLIKEYGSMHKLFILFIFGSMLITISVIFHSLVTKKNIPKKVILYLMLIEIATILCYLARRTIGQEPDVIVFAYLLGEFLILLLIRRIGKYEIGENIINSLDESVTNGYLAFDEKGRFVSCNDMAKVFLPELENQKVDTPLNQKETPLLYEQYGEVLNDLTVQEKKCLIESGERILACSLKTLHPSKGHRINGYLIEIADDTRQQKYLSLLNNYNDVLEKEVQKKTAYVNKLQERMVLGMADIIENRDTNTGGHVKRTSEVIQIFAEELKSVGKEYGFTDEFLRDVIKAAPMHDLGKIAVDDNILRKPGKYTPQEYEEMKKHSEKGAEIVAQILSGIEDETFVKIAVNVAHYHHEKWDGHGYPKQLSGLAIPPEARIMALADVFDALVSKRCYKEKMDFDNAFMIIEESLESHFDPEIGKLFLKCRPRLEAYYNTIE